MIAILLVFAGCFLLLHLGDMVTDQGRVLFGRHRTYVKVNLALLAAAAFSTERGLAGTPRGLVYTTFTVLALIDVFWAGYLGRQEKQEQQGCHDRR